MVSNAQELREKAEAFFQQRDQAEAPYGEAGLALALDMPLDLLRKIYDGEDRADLRDAVRWAYLRMQDQIESSPIFQKSTMATRASALLKQPRLGGYDGDSGGGTVRLLVRLGRGFDESDLQ